MERKGGRGGRGGRVVWCEYGYPNTTHWNASPICDLFYSWWQRCLGPPKQRYFATRRIMHYVISNSIPQTFTTTFPIQPRPPFQIPASLFTFSYSPAYTMPSSPLSKYHRMSYRIGRGETGVLTFEPYKSEILPLWRFKTPAIARKSSQEIYAKFEEYGKDGEGDFIGMDMCRKFLQMGMTRAKRYVQNNR
jgi:hypothetical protein